MNRLTGRTSRTGQTDNYKLILIMEKKKGWIIEAVIIALGLVVLGSNIQSGINNFVNKDRKVTVKGLSEMEVPANKVTWPIVSKLIGNDMQQLYRDINRNNQVITDFLKKNGIGEAEISVNPPVVIDMSAERYGADNKAYRYNITSVITVTSAQVEKVRSIIAKQGDLLKDGVAIVDGGYEMPIVYEFTSFSEIKPKMMEEAIQNAQKTAEQFAETSDSELRKIISADQGQFSIENRDSYTPYIKKLQGATAHVGTAHAPAGQPEQAKPDPVADLKAKLQEAISRENYEEAARLRDEIRRLEGQK